jgi:hypothetical protein
VASPRRRRTVLTLGQLKGRMSAGIEYATKLLEDETLDHDLRLRALNSQVQACLAYYKLIEASEFERELDSLEAVSARNGHAS